jgi:hypothetical protein
MIISILILILVKAYAITISQNCINKQNWESQLLTCTKSNNCCRISIDETYINNCKIQKNNTNVCNILHTCKNNCRYKISVTYICGLKKNIKQDLVLNECYDKCLINYYNCPTTNEYNKQAVDLWFICILFVLIILCVVLRQKCNHSSLKHSRKENTIITTVTV